MKVCKQHEANRNCPQPVKTCDAPAMADSVKLVESQYGSVGKDGKHVEAVSAARERRSARDLRGFTRQTTSTVRDRERWPIGLNCVFPGSDRSGPLRLIHEDQAVITVRH